MQDELLLEFEAAMADDDCECESSEREEISMKENQVWTFSHETSEKF